MPQGVKRKSIQKRAPFILNGKVWGVEGGKDFHWDMGKKKERGGGGRGKIGKSPIRKKTKYKSGSC